MQDTCNPSQFLSCYLTVPVRVRRASLRQHARSLAWWLNNVRVNGIVASPAEVDVTNKRHEDFTFTTDALTANSIVDVVFINDGYFEG